MRLLLLPLLFPAALAMEMLHGDAAVPAQRLCCRTALVVASEPAAAASWMQVYVCHPAQRRELLEAGLRCGAMGILPAGTELELFEAARNGGALKCRIIRLGSGESVPRLGSAPARPELLADASYPFAVPDWAPAEPDRLRPAPGTVICCDAAEARAATTAEPKP